LALLCRGLLNGLFTTTPFSQSTCPSCCPGGIGFVGTALFQPTTGYCLPPTGSLKAWSSYSIDGIVAFRCFKKPENTIPLGRRRFSLRVCYAKIKTRVEILIPDRSSPREGARPLWRSQRAQRGFGRNPKVRTPESTEDTEKEGIPSPRPQTTSTSLKTRVSCLRHFVLLSPWSPCPPWFTELAQENKILTSSSRNSTPPVLAYLLIQARPKRVCGGAFSPCRQQHDRTKEPRPP